MGNALLHTESRHKKMCNSYMCMLNRWVHRQLGVHEHVLCHSPIPASSKQPLQPLQPLIKTAASVTHPMGADVIRDASQGLMPHAWQGMPPRAHRALRASCLMPHRAQGRPTVLYRLSLNTHLPAGNHA